MSNNLTKTMTDRMSESFCKNYKKVLHRNPYLLRETGSVSNTFLLQESLVAKKGRKERTRGRVADRERMEGRKENL